MKKFIVMFILLTLILAMFLGCKKTTSSNDPTGINPEDYSFFMGIVKIPDFKSGYSIIFDSEKETITSIELKIDNEPIEVTHYAYGEYESWSVSDLAFTENHIYTFEVKINESKSVSNFSLKTPAIISGNWPETLNLTEATTFEWTQTQDSQYLEFSASAYKVETDEDIDKYEVLAPSARSYTMPADWLPSDYDGYYFSLVAGNYVSDSNLLAMAMTVDDMEYGYYKNQTDPMKRFRVQLKRFAKSIK